MTIAKLAHWIWFGDELPAWAKSNIELFRSLHADWQTRVWRELPSEFPKELRAIMEEIPWYSSRSDIFRYWLLATYGGVFLDTDILPLRNFLPLLDHRFFLAPCLPEGHTRPHLNCALMGCDCHSPAIDAVLKECIRYASEGAQPKRIAYGPDLLTRLFENGPEGVSILPKHYFYAIPDRGTTHRFWRSDSAGRAEILAPLRNSFSDDQEPYAVHLWGVEGSSQRKVVDYE